MKRHLGSFLVTDRPAGVEPVLSPNQNFRSDSSNTFRFLVSILFPMAQVSKCVDARPKLNYPCR
jgi:hypothetical protein